jgi:hypothetical protein
MNGYLYLRRLDLGHSSLFILQGIANNPSMIWAFRESFNVVVRCMVNVETGRKLEIQIWCGFMIDTDSAELSRT